MRAWVEIDLAALGRNIGKIQQMAAPLEVLGIIKSNAYGLGMLPIAKCLEENGVSFFGLACVEEALELRAAGSKAKLLIVGALFPEEIRVAEKEGFHICVASQEELDWVAEHAPKSKIHIKIDTGMTRLGFSYQEGEEALRFAKEAGLDLQGVFSHFSDADGKTAEARAFTSLQRERFLSYASREDIPYRHIFNSGALVEHPDEKVGNMVRVGICMYGILGNQIIPSLENVVSLKSKILYRKRVQEDSYVSYGREYLLKKGECYATLPLGYSDGVKRYLSKEGKVEILGVDCPIIGKVCMDMCMVKLPEEIFEQVEQGTEVCVFNNRLLAENTVEELCTWDIYTGLGRRVKRVYRNE